MPALDDLRGVAILMVIVLHVISPIWDSYGLPSWATPVANGSKFGVQLFFVISAFTLSLRLSRREFRPKDYVLRRIARIGPGYWAAALFYSSIGASLLPWPQHIGLTELLTAILFGSIWDGGGSLSVVPGGWSVCCEAAFYLALPILIVVIDGRIWRALAILIATIALAQSSAHPAMLRLEYDMGLYVQFSQQAPVFMCGVLAAVVAQRVTIPKLPGLAPVLLAAALLALPLVPLSEWLLLRHIRFALVAAAIVTLAAVNPASVFAGRIPRAIGTVSYSMYLVHFALIALSMRLAGLLVPIESWTTMVVQFVILSALSFVVARVTYVWIELPAIKWAADRSRRTVAVAAE